MVYVQIGFTPYKCIAVHTYVPVLKTVGKIVGLQTLLIKGTSRAQTTDNV
jgi:hypothetical protein